MEEEKSKIKNLIIGANGQLGYDLIRELQRRDNNNFLATYRTKFDTDLVNDKRKLIKLDIVDKKAVENVVSNYEPDIIFHAAAYTAVDKAQKQEDLAYEVNVCGTKNVAEVAKKVGAKLVYFSTDYVFNGTKDGYYEIDDKVNPINIYGKTKALGEEMAMINPKTFINRLSMVFGLNTYNTTNFVETMIKLSKKHKELTIVNDAFFSPSYTVDAAYTSVEIANTDKYGIYHLQNEWYGSPVDYARLIFRLMKEDITINEVTTKEYYKGKDVAPRALNLKLSRECLDKNGFERLPSLESALTRYLLEFKNRELEKEEIIKTKRKSL